MVDVIWKEFFEDKQTQRALESSEVWRNYSSAELSRDKLRDKIALEQTLDQENAVLKEIEDLRERIASNVKLKEYLQKVAKVLEENPELKAKADPNFIKGLSLLDFEE